MIPATSITFNDDGTAWVVIDAESPFIGTDGINAHILDKPCDNMCGDIGEPCDDCINGRHTFTVEVDNVDTVDEFIEHGSRRIYRVSVVPGVVLLITAEITDGASVQIAPDGTAFQLDAYVEGEPWSGGRRITLPPDAKPRMWAVLLAVHS